MKNKQINIHLGCLAQNMYFGNGGVTEEELKRIEGSLHKVVESATDGYLIIHVTDAFLIKSGMSLIKRMASDLSLLTTYNLAEATERVIDKVLKGSALDTSAAAGDILPPPASLPEDVRDPATNADTPL